jgi:WD40 repeat protein
MEEKRVTLSRPGVAEAKIRPDEKIFATAGWDRRVRAFRFGGKSPGGALAVLKCHAESVQALAFARPGAGNESSLLASGGKDARIALWELYPPSEQS